MIYCPHCSRPCVRDKGPCPHCGQDLSAGRQPPEKAAPAKAPAVEAQAPPPEERAPAVEAAPPALDGETEIDLGGDSEPSMLELASVSDPPPALHGGSAQDAGDGYDLDDESSEPLVLDVGDDAPPSLGTGGEEKREEPAEPEEEKVVAAPIDDDEVVRAAGFGTPRPGLLGSVKYALKVRERLAVLAGERDRAVESSERASARSRALHADLGRKGFFIGMKGRPLENLIDRARRTESDLESARRRRVGIEAEHEDRRRVLEQEIEKIEAETAPLRAEEDEARASHEARLKEQKRFETQLKRSEIELRNLDEMIEKRQQMYADLEKPKEERARILDEIAKYDNARPAVLARIEEHRDQIGMLSLPVTEASERLAAARDKLAESRARIEALRHEIEQISRYFSDAEGAAAREVESEALAVEQAWADVGEEVFARRAESPDLDDLSSSVLGAMRKAVDTDRRARLLARALDSYDRDVVHRAKVVAAAGAAIAVAALIVLFVFLIS